MLSKPVSARQLCVLESYFKLYYEDVFLCGTRSADVYKWCVKAAKRELVCLLVKYLISRWVPQLIELKLKNGYDWFFFFYEYWNNIWHSCSWDAFTTYTPCSGIPIPILVLVSDPMPILFLVSELILVLVSDAIQIMVLVSSPILTHVLVYGQASKLIFISELILILVLDPIVE